MIDVFIHLSASKNCSILIRYNSIQLHYSSQSICVHTYDRIYVNFIIPPLTFQSRLQPKLSKLWQHRPILTLFLKKISGEKCNVIFRLKLHIIIHKMHLCILFLFLVATWNVSVYLWLYLENENTYSDLYIIM